ncbi:MAG: glycosyltransferase family 4 protein [Terrimicrobiaceae bacterium]|nr:glycosyltransferase family 4 protein [Terrimicrobiaceae bacterium]
MKILLSSHAFFPMLGGIEAISRVLADEFVKAGHEVHLITQTPRKGSDSFSFAVTRQPSNAEVLRLARWSDVFFQNNISIRTLAAALPVQRRVIIAHQTWIRRTDSRPSLLHWLKSQTSRLAARNVAISNAVAQTIPSRCELIPNPYDHRTFRRVEDVERDRELIFVGRIVSDKGCDILLNALARLARRGCTPRLTIVGQGPEETALRQQAASLGIQKQVTFAGPLQGDALARMLNRHRVLVVPSRWAEPFGIVALEGIECGCCVIGSAEGGLPEAIGPCGFTFPNGNNVALAETIEFVLNNPDAVAQKLAAAPAHLKKHQGDTIARRYLKLFSELLG